MEIAASDFVIKVEEIQENEAFQDKEENIVLSDIPANAISTERTNSSLDLEHPLEITLNVGSVISTDAVIVEDLIEVTNKPRFNQHALNEDLPKTVASGCDIDAHPTKGIDAMCQNEDFGYVINSKDTIADSADTCSDVRTNQEEATTDPDGDGTCKEDLKSSKKGYITPSTGCIVNTLEEAFDELRQHELKLTVRYVSLQCSRNFGYSSIPCKKKRGNRILWESSLVKFSGVPFMQVGVKYMECHHGKDHSKRKKEGRGTVKLDCPALVVMKEIIVFVDIKMEEENKQHKRQPYNRYIHQIIAEGRPLKFKKQFHVLLPEASHHNHDVGQKQDVREWINKDLANFIRAMIRSNKVQNEDELSDISRDYVQNTLFAGQTPPPTSRKQFYPDRRHLREFIRRVRGELNIRAANVSQLQNFVADRIKQHQGELFSYNFSKKHEVVLSKKSQKKKVVNENTNTSFNKIIATTDDAAILDEHISNVLICHQNTHQQRLMRRYGSLVFLTQIDEMYTHIVFPLFCLFVQTNVNFHIVGLFVLYGNDKDMISEGLTVIRDWNPGWRPKHVMCDFSPEQIDACQSIFLDSVVYISDASRHRDWTDWLTSPQNGVADLKSDIYPLMESIANATSDQALNNSLQLLESSEVFQMSEKFQNWFQFKWLSEAKRWVKGYRSEDFLLFGNITGTIRSKIDEIAQIKLRKEGFVLVDLLSNLLNEILPRTKLQYETLNQNSFNLQREILEKHPSLSHSMENLPANLIWHVYKKLQEAERIQEVDPANMQVTQLQAGEFTLKYPGQSKLSVQTLMEGSSSFYEVTLEEDEREHTVSFGDSSSYPSCQCQEWHQTKLPCVHFASVFKFYPSWSFDMISAAYRCHSVLNLDWACIKDIVPPPPTNATSADFSTQTEPLGNRKIEERLRCKELNEKMLTLSSTQCQHFIKLLLKINLWKHSTTTLTLVKKKLVSVVSSFLPMVDVDKLCRLCPILSKIHTSEIVGGETQQRMLQKELPQILEFSDTSASSSTIFSSKKLVCHCLELLYVIQKFRFTSYSHQRLVILKAELKTILLQLLSARSAASTDSNKASSHQNEVSTNLNITSGNRLIRTITPAMSTQTPGKLSPPSLKVVPTGLVLHYINSKEPMYVPILSVGGQNLNTQGFHPIAKRTSSTEIDLPLPILKKRKGRKKVEKPSAAEVIEHQLSLNYNSMELDLTGNEIDDIAVGEDIHTEVLDYLRKN